MNLKDKKQAKFALVQEMMETVDVIKDFDIKAVTPFTNEAKSAGRVFLTGEGSSRIFPAKNAISKSLTWGMLVPVFTDGARQASEYVLDDFAVFCASNSGRTKEVIELADKLKRKRHSAVFGITAAEETKLESLTAMAHVLCCGKEEAVAATKSVVEQALFYHAMVAGLSGRRTECRGLANVSTAFRKALETKIPPSIVKPVAEAPRIYFAGRNDGVAEELTLKTNEITRKPSAFLEGTYAVHGIEEVMQPDEVVIWLDPFEKEVEKFREVLEKGVGMKVVAISQKKLPIPTIQVPACKNFEPYMQLAAGWNLLVAVGMANKIDLDHPARARKVGNEVVAS
jgi:glucosamine--fructose-6-phosphate aminotransferase (isomerizing)